MVWEGWRRKASPYPDQSPHESASRAFGITGFCRALFWESDAIGPPADVAGLGGTGLAGADPFTCAAAAPFWPSASKSP